MRIGFTGTQTGLTPMQFNLLVEVLGELHEVTEAHHGDCIGADFEFATIVKCVAPDVVVHRHPPTNKTKRANTRFDVDHPPKEYLVRNKEIVRAADFIIACPKGQHEEQRSGTWSTVRFARRCNMPIVILWPDGKYNYEEGIIPLRAEASENED